ncbi:hypothetical protein M0R45_026392 [Rubus argutus]|uniref:peroxidase n=1 Tax=Rubus argutus TaxID=59490 RepID=A0AAW1WXG2_RUBAR
MYQKSFMSLFLLIALACSKFFDPWCKAKTPVSDSIRVRVLEQNPFDNGQNTEKTAGPKHRLRLRNYRHDAKTKLDAAACDSIILTKGIDWNSKTSALPGLRDSKDVQKAKFNTLGLNTQDLVTLVGGHTIGTAACQLFSYRLYLTSTQLEMVMCNPSYRWSFIPFSTQITLPTKWRWSQASDLDTGSTSLFDATVFTNLKNGRRILKSDQMHVMDWCLQKKLCPTFLGCQTIRGLRALNFNAELGRSMMKMSTIGLKPVSKSEIHCICSVIN